MSSLNSWVSPLFKDTLFFQIGQPTQKVWFFEGRCPLIFSQNLQKNNLPYLRSRSSDQWKISDWRYGVKTNVHAKFH